MFNPFSLFFHFAPQLSDELTSNSPYPQCGGRIAKLPEYSGLLVISNTLLCSSFCVCDKSWFFIFIRLTCNCNSNPRWSFFWLSGCYSEGSFASEGACMACPFRLSGVSVHRYSFSEQNFWPTWYHGFSTKCNRGFWGIFALWLSERCPDLLHQVDQIFLTGT